MCVCVLPPWSLLPGRVSGVVGATAELIESHWKVTSPDVDVLTKR